MTSDERKILGINGSKEAQTLFDIVLRQATTLATLSATLTAQEQARAEAKKGHDERLAGIEQTVCGLDGKVDTLCVEVAKMPADRQHEIAEAIKACAEMHDKDALTKRQKVQLYAALIFGTSGLAFGLAEYIVR